MCDIMPTKPSFSFICFSSHLFDFFSFSQLFFSRFCCYLLLGALLTSYSQNLHLSVCQFHNSCRFIALFVSLLPNFVPLSISTTWPFSSPRPLHLSLSGLALSHSCFSCGSIKKKRISPFLCPYKHALFVFPSAALLCFATSRQSCWQRWARAYLKCHWKNDKRSYGK